MENIEKRDVLDNDDPHAQPVIFAIEAYRGVGPHDDGRPPERLGQDDEPKDDAYWAGRNHAMRRSARWAA